MREIHKPVHDIRVATSHIFYTVYDLKSTSFRSSHPHIQQSSFWLAIPPQKRFEQRDNRASAYLVRALWIGTLGDSQDPRIEKKPQNFWNGVFIYNKVHFKCSEKKALNICNFNSTCWGRPKITKAPAAPTKHLIAVMMMWFNEKPKTRCTGCEPILLLPNCTCFFNFCLDM